jgi:hypothetical protein
MDPTFVDHDVTGTVHRLEVVIDLLDRHRRVHVLAVIFEVTGDLVDLFRRDVGGVDKIVAAGKLLLLLELLDEVADDAALGVPQDETRPDLLTDREEVELPPEPTVVSLLGLLESPQVRVKLGLRGPGRSVDALQHRPLLVAPPVGARYR